MDEENAKRRKTEAEVAKGALGGVDAAVAHAGDAGVKGAVEDTGAGADATPPTRDAKGADAMRPVRAADSPRSSSTLGHTELMPGGGRPAHVESSRTAPSEGHDGTLPMPKPGPRPDDPTRRLPSEADVPTNDLGSANAAHHDSEASLCRNSAADPVARDHAPESPREPVSGPTRHVPGDVAHGSVHAPTKHAAAAARGPASGPTRHVPGDVAHGSVHAPAQHAAASPQDLGSAIADLNAWFRERLRWRAKWGLVAFAITVAACALVGGFVVLGTVMAGPVIPNVVGMSANDAQARLKDEGFSVELSQTPADENIGEVVLSDPAAGQRARKGSVVTISVATPRVVPSITGTTSDDAKKALEKAGIANARFENKNSDEDAGTVIGVQPGEGSVVTANDAVVVQVAQPYTVPDVSGLSQDDATKAIAEAGLQSKIEWQEADGSVRTVLSTTPAAGERVKSGSTVTVTVVAPGPRNELYLPGYLSSDPKDVSSYLAWKGWKFEFGTTAKGAGSFASQDVAEQGWSKAGVGQLVFTSAPASPRHGVLFGDLLTSDVMATGVRQAGVRLVPEEGKGAAVDSATVNNWASRCGLAGLQGVVSGSDVASAMGLSGRAADTLTGWGEQDGLVWSVTVAKDGGVSVTCAPSGLYDGLDLADYGGSLGVYLAYVASYEG